MVPTASPMRQITTLPFLVVLAMSCTPKVCDETQPLPNGYEGMAAILPKAAVVCKDGPNPKAVFLNFASRDVKQLTLETMLHLREAGWALSSSTRAEDLAGYIDASRGKQSLHIGINRQNGGPYAGRITGSIFLSGAPASP